MLRVRRHLCTLVSLLLTTAASWGGQSDLARAAPELAPRLASADSLPVAAKSFALPFRDPAASVALRLPHMIHAAGAIFAGTVTAITRSPALAKDAVATVAITFHVDRGLRGTITGQDFTIHQWAGLWNSGQQRYRVGERVLLFLYPASKLGLTSWVSGSLGRFRFNNLGRVLLSPEHIAAFRGDPVLGGKPTIGMEDFAWAVRRASAGEGILRRP